MSNISLTFKNLLSCACMKVKFFLSFFKFFSRAFQHEETSANAAHNQWNLENSQSPLHRLKLPSSGAVGKHVALLRCSVYQTIIFLYYKPANFCRLVSLKNRLAFLHEPILTTAPCPNLPLYTTHPSHKIHLAFKIITTQYNQASGIDRRK